MLGESGAERGVVLGSMLPVCFHPNRTHRCGLAESAGRHEAFCLRGTDCNSGLGLREGKNMIKKKKGHCTLLLKDFFGAHHRSEWVVSHELQHVS